MKPNFLCLVVATLLSGGAYAQALVEHAVAAAGATAGTTGGKGLSNMIDKALSKAATAATEAAASGAKKPNNKAAPDVIATPSPKGEVAPPAPSPSTQGEMAQGTKRARAARPPTPAPSKPAFAAADQRLKQGLSAPVFAPAPPPAIADFAKVKEGGARQDVFAALGTPSSHITIPDEGHLIEILSYSDGRRRIGSVRLDNGQVVSVSTVP